MTDPTPQPLSRILIVEDDSSLMFVVRTVLENHGYRIIQADNGGTGLELALKEHPDLVVLDVDMPVLNGIEVCQELRRLHFGAPILMLTVRQHIEDKVTGLNAGADDYLGKPFDGRELLARVQSLLRRRSREEQELLALELGDVRVDFGGKTATRAGRPLALTKTEFALLGLLARHSGQTVSRETILDVVWGYARFPNTRTVDTHIWRLRKKIGDDGDEPRWIKRIHGQGYSLIAPPSAPAASGSAPPGAAT